MFRAVRACTLTGFAVLFFSGLLSAQVRNDFFIPVGPADSLDATSFTPTTAPPEHGYPVLLMIHGFGDTKEARIPSCRIYAASGFLTLAYTVRGHGRSSGESGIMSNRERDDLARVVGFIKHIPGADSDAIGVIGGSQGGLHVLWALSDRLTIEAGSADAITALWASDMFMNGSVRRTFVLLLQSPGVRYSAERDTLWNLLCADRYEELRERFIRQRDLDLPRLQSATVPLLQFLKWQDHYFSAGPGISQFAGYTGPKKLYLGTQGHFSDEIDDERNFQNGQITGWFNYYLRGIKNGAIDTPRCTIAVSGLPVDSSGNFRWTRNSSDLWPPSGVVGRRLYLSGDSLLSIRIPAAQPRPLVLANRYSDSSYTFIKGYIEGFRGSYFSSIIPQDKIVFSSPPLDSDLVWEGSPTMHLSVKSTDASFPIHLQIYETDSSGRSFFINRINYTARHWKKRSTGVITAEGLAHAHRFSRGSRITVVLTNIDVTNRKQLGEYPYVLPLFRNASVSLYSDKRHPSWIELPCQSEFHFKPAVTPVRAKKSKAGR